MIKTIQTLVLPVCLLACSIPEKSHTASAAILINPNRVVLQQLEQFISNIMHRPMSIPASAFTKTDTLIFERPFLLGRDFSKPATFKLKLINDQCVIQHLASTAMRRLDGASCIPLKR